MGSNSVTPLWVFNSFWMMLMLSSGARSNFSYKKTIASLFSVCTPYIVQYIILIALLYVCRSMTLRLPMEFFMWQWEAFPRATDPSSSPITTLASTVSQPKIDHRLYNRSWCNRGVPPLGLRTTVLKPWDWHFGRARLEGTILSKRGGVRGCVNHKVTPP